MPMKRLLPDPASTVELVDAYVPPEPPADRPSVRCNMISTFDGAIAVNGRSGLLGGPADHRVFAVLRSWADVIVVGAGTVRAEGYGPVRLDDDLRDRRRARGQLPVPPIAIVTRSGNLDWSSSLFAAAEVRPLVVTPSDSGVETRARGEQVADFVLAGTDRVDLSTALNALHRLGHRTIQIDAVDVSAVVIDGVGVGASGRIGLHGLNAVNGETAFGRDLHLHDAADL